MFKKNLASFLGTFTATLVLFGVPAYALGYLDFRTSAQMLTLPGGAKPLAWLVEKDYRGERAGEPYARLLVAVRQEGSLCSGSTLTGTNLVVTAAHCVVAKTGYFYEQTLLEPEDLWVERGSDVYRVMNVRTLPLVEVFDRDGVIRIENDVAVLTVDRPIPGPGAAGVAPVEETNSGGRVFMLGLQPMRGGAWLREEDLDMYGAAAPAEVGTVPAFCDVGNGRLHKRRARSYWLAECGMVGGASGGPVMVENSGEYWLVGVVSTVNRTLDRNGIASVEAIERLLFETNGNQIHLAERRRG